jgi:hypothetical protein
MEEPKLEQFGLNKEKHDYLKKNEDKGYTVILIFCVILGVLATSYFQIIEPVKAFCVADARGAKTEFLARGLMR